MQDDVQPEIKRIFQACERLTKLTGRPFSPDGHLVGSFGELVASRLLDLTLAPPSTDGYDAIDQQGRRVEIKTTTRSAIALSASGTKAERLVVVAIGASGKPSIVYDGPSSPAWEAAGRPQKNGQRRIALSTLDGLVD